MVYENLIDLIGNTPVIKLNNIFSGDIADIYVKLEGYNLGNSVKDRAALGMIEAAEKAWQKASLQKALQNARNFKRLGIPLEIISQGVGLSIEEIENL